MSVFTDLLERAVEEGDLAQDDYDQILRLLNPPPPETFEEYLRAEIQTALVNVALYGQPTVPTLPQDLRGIQPDFVWVDEVDGFSIAPPSPADVDAILHDPLWGLTRSRPWPPTETGPVASTAST